MLRNCIFVLLFAASLSSYGAVRTVIVQPGQLIPTYGPGVGGDAFIDGRDWNATVSDQKGSRHTVPVTLEKKYSWPAFRGALKNALKLNPSKLLASGVIAGALAGVDWVMSPENTEIRKKEKTLDGNPVTVSSAPSITPFNICFHLPASSTLGKHTILTNGETTYSVTVIKPVDFNIQYPPGYEHGSNCTQTWNGYTSSGGWPVAAYKLITVSQIQESYLPVTDSDLDSFVTGFTDGSQAADIAPHILESVPGSFDYPDSETFGGPNSVELPSVETTTLDQVTGDSTVVQETTTLDMVYGTNPLSITTNSTTVTNTYQNGTLTNTSTSTVTGPTVDAQPLSEVPTDCEFMPTVCEWLAWFKEPIPMPDVELPTPEDQDFEESYSASFGGGCPPPRQIALTLFPPVQFSWQPLCDFAGYLKFLVVGGAALMAAFIGLGISRGNA